MNKFYVFGAILGITFLLLSNSANPPDAHTGAPGETFCANCHSLNGSLNQGTITVEGFPSTINPEETYSLTVVNRNTVGDAVRAGFQMTILGPTNTKAGDMTLPTGSHNCIVSNSGGRQYFEHNPFVEYPDSNVVKWTVLWRDSIIANGDKITYYACGIIGNGNMNSTGDRTVTAKGSGIAIVTGSKELAFDKPTIYPNPGTNVMNIELPDHPQPEGQVYFYDISGKMVAETDMHSGIVNTTFLPSLVYLLQIRNSDRSYSARWVKI